MAWSVRTKSPCILILATMVDDTVISHRNVSSYFKCK